jgi:hypothetical protein
MFIGNDLCCTNNKASIKLFPTVEDAKAFIPEWKATTSVQYGREPLKIVEVQTKVVVKQIGKVVESVNVVMQYNTCKTCLACDGRAGNLFDDECKNCCDTRESGDICVHTHLQRTAEELQRTFDILGGVSV